MPYDPMADKPRTRAPRVGRPKRDRAKTKASRRANRARRR